jgi:hypothetical protein
MHFTQQGMPPSEQENKNKVGSKRRRTVPNDDARKTTRQVCQNSRDNAGYRDRNPEPKTEKPCADGDWRQVKDEKRILETSNVVKPANEGDKNETCDYDQTSAKHGSLI